MLIDTARKEGMMNMLNCVLMIVWNASLSFKCAYGVTELEDFYAPEGGSAHFPWLSLSPFTTVDWYDGGASSTIMMEYSAIGLDKNTDYNIDYINETNSVGMILRDIKKKNDSGLYTVKVVLTSGPTEQSDTNLVVLTAEEIKECENSKNVKINDVEVACGDSNVKPGSMKISSSMTCLLDKVLMVNCSEDSSDGSTSSCGNCSQLPCELPEFNVVANTKVTLTFWSGKWQGSEFNCEISVTDQGSSNPCEPTPCVFGTCSIDCASTYMCKCFVNYQGRNCSHRFAIITGPPTSGPPDIIVGSNYTFNLTTNTTADLWWSYEQNGPAIVKNNQATFLPLQISPVYLANNTQYYFGCAKIDPYVECKRYSVHAIYNWVFEEPEADMNTSRVSRTVRVGEYLTINCTITGEPLPYVQWWLNVSSPNDSSETIQQFISNASIGTASLIIDSISLDDITTYYCRASFLDISLDRTVTLVLGGKTQLSTGAKVGIGLAVVCISVIMINIVIFVLKKKQTHGNTFCKNNQPAENGKTEQETSKGANDAPKEKNSMDEGQMNTRVPSLATDTPRKLPPLNLPPVNRVNPEDNADVQEHEMKRKKKKKHKKRHHDEKEHNADPEQNGETNPEYNEGEYEEV